MNIGVKKNSKYINKTIFIIKAYYRKYSQWFVVNITYKHKCVFIIQFLLNGTMLVNKFKTKFKFSNFFKIGYL